MIGMVLAQLLQRGSRGGNIELRREEGVPGIIFRSAFIDQTTGYSRGSEEYTNLAHSLAQLLTGVGLCAVMMLASDHRRAKSKQNWITPRDQPVRITLVDGKLGEARCQAIRTGIEHLARGNGPARSARYQVNSGRRRSRSRILESKCACRRQKRN